MNAFSSSARVFGRRVVSTTGRRALSFQAKQGSSSSTMPLVAAAGLAAFAGIAIQSNQQDVSCGFPKWGGTLLVISNLSSFPTDGHLQLVWQQIGRTGRQGNGSQVRQLLAP